VSAGPTEIFVYGTLQRAGSNHGQLAGQRWLAAARTRQLYRLYDLDGYPGMIAAAPGAGLSIPGEVWAVDAACLARLDQFEGVDQGLYQRAVVQLEGPPERAGVLTYLYLRPVTGRRELARWGAAGGEPR
jgi:gamma-glutamylaminecyclotransferase